MDLHSGHIVFINSHDYVSDVTGTEAVGCLATLSTAEDGEVMLYTGSLRLQHTLEMAYASKCAVGVDYWETEASVTEQQHLVSTARAGESSDEFHGPFRLKALWTLE